MVASSTGNHGAAVAYAAQLLGWKARIFLPGKNNPVKRANIARLGAEIVEKGAVDLAGHSKRRHDMPERLVHSFLTMRLIRTCPPDLEQLLARFSSSSRKWK